MLSNFLTVFSYLFYSGSLPIFFFPFWWDRHFLLFLFSLISPYVCYLIYKFIFWVFSLILSFFSLLLIRPFPFSQSLFFTFFFFAGVPLFTLLLTSTTLRFLQNTINRIRRMRRRSEIQYWNFEEYITGRDLFFFFFLFLLYRNLNKKRQKIYLETPVTHANTLTSVLLFLLDLISFCSVVLNGSPSEV